MQKVLIVEDNVIQCKEIINYISQINENIKIYSIAYTCEEALKFVRTEEVDIILLHLNLPDASGTQIIEFIKENNIRKYLGSVIVITGEKCMLSSIKDSPYIFSCISKPYNLENIHKSLKNICVTKKDDKIKNSINRELSYLKYNFSYNGTRYLAETIFEIYKKEDFLIDNLKRDIYPIIAKRHNKSVNTICGNIKQATKCMCLDCDEKILNNYFCYSYFVQPKLKEIIFTILNKI